MHSCAKPAAFRGGEGRETGRPGDREGERARYRMEWIVAQRNAVSPASSAYIKYQNVIWYIARHATLQRATPRHAMPHHATPRHAALRRAAPPRPAPPAPRPTSQLTGMLATHPTQLPRESAHAGSGREGVENATWAVKDAPTMTPHCTC